MYQATPAVVLPLCSCDDTPESIKISNFVLVIVILPILAFSGFIFNLISFIVFFKQYLFFKSSPCIYLIALAISDCGVCICGLMVMSADSFRAYSPSMNEFWTPLIPKMVPVALIFQMSSVYFTVMAAMDCFFYVAPFRVKKWWCKPKFARNMVIFTTLAIVIYNFVTFYELEHSECYSVLEHRSRFQICPTQLRDNFYFRLYKGYMYVVTMAVLPCSLLLGLCFGIFQNMRRRRWSDVIQEDANNRLILQNHLIRNYSMQTLLAKSRSRDLQSGSSPLMLVVVVILFLLCNSVSLIVNCLEILTGDSFAELNLMLIDVSNVLVVFNAWANFFVYILLSQSYRLNLKSICNYSVLSPSTASKVERITAL